MKKLLILVTLLLALVITVPAQAAEVRLAWDMPAVSDPAAIGVRILYGLAEGSWMYTHDVGYNSPTSTTVTQNLEWKKTYYFTAQAYDADGNVSAFSNVVSKTLTSEVESLVIQNLRLD